MSDQLSERAKRFLETADAQGRVDSLNTSRDVLYELIRARRIEQNIYFGRLYWVKPEPR